MTRILLSKFLANLFENSAPSKKASQKLKFIFKSSALSYSDLIGAKKFFVENQDTFLPKSNWFKYINAHKLIPSWGVTASILEISEPTANLLAKCCHFLVNIAEFHATVQPTMSRSMTSPSVASVFFCVSSILLFFFKKLHVSSF